MPFSLRRALGLAAMIVRRRYLASDTKRGLSALAKGIWGNIGRALFGRSRIYAKEYCSFGEFDREALRCLIRKALRPGCVMLEVGSWLGMGSTRVFAEELQSVGGVLYCVDTWQGSPNVAKHREIVERYDVLATFRHNVQRYATEGVVHPLVGPSAEIAGVIRDGAFDLIFLDGDHSYVATQADIAAWSAKLRTGGILCGHDCEARVTSGNAAQYKAARDKDFIPAVASPFLVEHPGVILAVDEAFGGSAHLWAEDPVRLPDGRTGASSIWDVHFGPADELPAR